MQDQVLLDLLQRTFKAAGHPEVAEVARFDNGHTYGVKVTFINGAVDYLTVSDEHGRLLAPRRR